jgi:hypothetical protein
MIEGYNSTYTCKYSTKEDTDINDDLYRKELLKIFNVANWDEEKIMTIIDQIVQAFSEEDWFIKMLHDSPFFDEYDQSYSLCGLFNFHQMSETHKQLCSKINEKVQ